MRSRLLTLHALLLAAATGWPAAGPQESKPLDRETMDQWAAPFRHWHYHPDYVVPDQPNIPGYEKFQHPDVPCVFQLPGQSDRWFMSFIAFNGRCFTLGWGGAGPTS